VYDTLGAQKVGDRLMVLRKDAHPRQGQRIEESFDQTVLSKLRNDVGMEQQIHR